MKATPRQAGAAAVFLCIAALAGLAAWGLGLIFPGQELPGRVTDHYTALDGWELVCDTATDGSDPRCYLQYVDVYRPRPDFAAAMAELVMHEGEDGRPVPVLRFDIEPGLAFSRGRLGVTTADGIIEADLADCPGNTCVFSGAAARGMLDQWRQGTGLVLQIEHGDERIERTWPLTGMDELLDVFARERRARNLP